MYKFPGCIKTKMIICDFTGKPSLMTAVKSFLFLPIIALRKTHMAYRKKYKALILK